MLRALGACGNEVTRCKVVGTGTDDFKVEGLGFSVGFIVEGFRAQGLEDRIWCVGSARQSQRPAVCVEEISPGQSEQIFTGDRCVLAEG